MTRGDAVNLDFAAQLTEAAEAAIASFDEASKKSKTCAVSAAKKVLALEWSLGLIAVLPGNLEGLLLSANIIVPQGMKCSAAVGHVWRLSAVLLSLL
jgi:hypothetical protein